MGQCSCRCPDQSHIEAGHRNHVKSILDGVTVGTTRKSRTLMTQWWLRLMKRYISNSGKLLSRLELPIHTWTYIWLIGWLLNSKIQYLRPLLSGFPTGKYRIWSICWEMMQMLGRERPSFESGKSWHSAKEPSTIATNCMVSWKKFCGL